MTTHVLKIPYDEEALRELGATPQDVEHQMRLAMAAKLFEMGKVSTGKAAELAGMPVVEFILALGAMGVPVVDLDDDDIAYELGIGRP